jgi:AraC-like DNA-binding protein
MSSHNEEWPKPQLPAGREAPPADLSQTPAGAAEPSGPPVRPEHGNGVRQRLLNFAEEVRRNIRSNLDNPALSAETVAKLHGIDRRTLSRRLSAEGTSFSELHRSLRYERACMLLRETTAPLSAITAALGYSEQSAFNRAFQIWTGISPKRFRSI